MGKAVELARRAGGYVHPNPQVGAVIVDESGEIIGQGWHREYGGLHAEVEALRSLAPGVHPDTMYVTLEPCCHWGKQPPCVDALIAAGVRRVVVGCVDANPEVSGKGIAALRAAGVEVDVADDHAALLLSRPFRYGQTTGLPWFTVKWAASLDGKIAAASGASQWITGPSARHCVHELRAQYAGIMTGIGTVLADDPRLTVRLAGRHHQPIRIVADTFANTPADSALVRTAHTIPTWILTSADTENPRVRDLVQAGVTVITVPSQDGHVDLTAAARELYRRGVNTVLVEAGARLVGGLFDASLVGDVHTFIAPLVLGGVGHSPVAGRGVSHPDAGVHLSALTYTQVGKDLHIHGFVQDKEI